MAQLICGRNGSSVFAGALTGKMPFPCQAAIPGGRLTVIASSHFVRAGRDKTSLRLGGKPAIIKRKSKDSHLLSKEMPSGRKEASGGISYFDKGAIS